MQARLCTVVIGLASTAAFACASGEIDDGGGTFTTANTTNNNDTLGETRGDTGEGNDEAETGHPEDEGETDEPTPDPTCDDGEQNQDETDVDCGGATCGGCSDGQACSNNSDCEMDSCVGGLCIVPTCTDGVANGDETDVDCGGSCGACGDGQGCVGPGDCTSGVCAGSFCAAPNCGDAVQNGSETDLDCGGGSCGGCAEGGTCSGDADCLSQYCLNGACAPADCLTDADCAEFNTQCTTGVCNANKTCDAVAANNGMACNDGDLCSNGETCSAGSCGGGAPLDCSGMSNACNLGVCNPQSGSCTTQPANNGNPCNDNNACTVSEVCNAGQCADPNAPGYVLYEDFNDNSAGWSLGPEWQIGAAAASAGCNSCPGNDPANDHTATADNGIAGVLIGGCTGTTVHGDYCLTSPAMNTANLATVWLTYWRHLHADYPNFMTSHVQVFNGVTWNQVWTGPANLCTNDTDWTQMAHNITAFKATNMQVRFCFSVGSTGVYPSGSWNLDDIVVGPAQCNP